MRYTCRVVLFFFTCLLGFSGHLVAGEYDGIGHVELKKMIDQDLREFVLVDARNPEEYKEAHIPGAINIPEKEFSRFTGLLPSNKNSMLIFYCNGVKCGKSKKSAKKALELGYAKILVYAEGMPVWEEMGYSFYKGTDYEKRIETTKLSPQQLNILMKTGNENIQVVDVRDKEEFTEGHIPGSVNLPLGEFALGSDMLDKKKSIIVYCNSGGRSYGAYRKLMRLGYKNIYQAIFADWKEQGLPVSL